MKDVLLCNLFSRLQMWTNWEKAWTNSRKVENWQNHCGGVVFEVRLRSAKLFSVLNYFAWKFYQSPTYPPSTGSNTWTPEIDTRSRLGAPNTIFVKIKVWFFSKHDFVPTVSAFRICTLFWPEVAHLTGSCEKCVRRVQVFITFSTSWWFYVSFMFLVQLIGVLESHLDVLRVVSDFLQTLSAESIKTCTEVTKNKNRFFQRWLKVEVKVLLWMISKDKLIMKNLFSTFLQRLMRCTFKKMFKNFEKTQVFF